MPDARPTALLVGGRRAGGALAARLAAPRSAAAPAATAPGVAAARAFRRGLGGRRLDLGTLGSLGLLAFGAVAVAAAAGARAALASALAAGRRGLHARGDDRVERLDAVVGGLEEQVGRGGLRAREQARELHGLLSRRQ